MGLNKGYLTAKKTSESDECLTPSYAVLPIIKYLKAKDFRVIWCPFDLEHSKYVKLLQKEGFKVISTHINNGEDFFNYEPTNYDCIVSNPPFSLKDLIIKRLYNLNKPFAILLPQNTLQSISRTPLFIEYGVEYLGFDKRVCFYTSNNLLRVKTGNAFASGYFCHNVLPEKLIFEILEVLDEPYFN